MSNVTLEFYKKNEIKPEYSLRLDSEGLSRAEFTNLIYDVAAGFCRVTNCTAWSVRDRLDVITELKENG